MWCKLTREDSILKDSFIVLERNTYTTSARIEQKVISLSRKLNIVRASRVMGTVSVFRMSLEYYLRSDI